MSRLGPGSLLATQRYAVRERLAAAPGWERWDCHDTTLDRPVVAVTFPAGAPDAAAAIDVARRAASLEDPRLVRILDVVVQDDVAAVIEEPLPQARSLTRIIHDGPLPSEEARRIIGEAATALASAEARGLHHHLVSPDAIRVLADGGVKVRGLSYEAALAGIDIDDGRAGSLRDAQGLCSCCAPSSTSCAWSPSPTPTGRPSARLARQPRLLPRCARGPPPPWSTSLWCGRVRNPSVRWPRTICPRSRPVPSGPVLPLPTGAS